ncbi:type II toxin-antitoxin system Phd/YefM family antitoxin [Olsenella sp. kh2p3]|uniref:type II toxin-antitoxin system Phd/YefM family antitoxin n=1 Tax=Olsenella sp. kh2p3 TaxID=1797112 RepID=UPI0009102C84|nr:type II toxin-antitoxin system Phd/YefM family antitoxin [Olsenella sp. kh2p3]SFX31176.1 prevent-host-death family protein [Olsenella sp. kh2p3]
MPAMTSLSEFNRHQSETISELEKTGEPLYLTRNGKSAVVVMDADAFDRMVSAKEELRTREMAVYDGLMQGYQDVLDGKTAPAQDVFTRIRSKRGW